MKIECILQLMEEKGYISKNSIEEHDGMPKVDMIINYRGPEFGKKLFNAIVQSKEYLFDQTQTYVNFSKFEIAKKSDIDEWLQNFADKENSTVPWSNMRLDKNIFEYLKKNGYKAKKEYNYLKIKNIAIYKKRIKEEEAKNQEAIDLLDKLL